MVFVISDIKNPYKKINKFTSDNAMTVAYPIPFAVRNKSCFNRKILLNMFGKIIAVAT